MPHTTAADIIDALTAMRSEAKASQLTRFFRTGPGQYGEGDRFLGLTVPQTRTVVRHAAGRISHDEIATLLDSPWHEVRLAALLLLVADMNAAIPRRRQPPEANAYRRDRIAAFYLAHARRANNWDLVDLSCPGVIGQWLLLPSASGAMPDRHILDRLAASDSLWEQRIAIVSTLTLIRAGQLDDTLRLAEMLLDHPHHLIHKATGWMLREAGKRCPQALDDFLRRHWARMPRTALRYAIERLPEPARTAWLHRR